MASTGNRNGRPRTAERTRRDASAAASTASSAGVRARMQVQRTRDTAPELAVRRLLHAAGLRYRVDRPPLPGLRRRADLVFGPARVAVYVDGCFWHGCLEHGTRPVANAQWWRDKLERTRARDRDTDERLAAAGWTVVRAWEHEAPEEVALRVAAVVRERRLRLPAGPRPAGATAEHVAYPEAVPTDSSPVGGPSSRRMTASPRA